MKRFLFSLLLLPTLTHAYQANTNFHIRHYDIDRIDYSSSETSSKFAIGYSFIEIDDSKGPLELANFLNKVSNIHVSYMEDRSLDNNSEDVSGSGISGTYVFNNGFKISGGYSLTRTDGFGTDEDWNINAGYYLSDTQLLSSSIISNEDWQDFNLRYFGLHKSDDDKYFSIGANFQFSEEENLDAYYMNINFSYYINHALSHTTSITSQQIEMESSSEINYSLGYGVKYFITRTLDTGFFVSYLDNSFNNSESKSFIASINKRF